MRTLAAIAPALLLLACGSPVAGTPAPTSTASLSTASATPVAPAAGVTVGGGCDLLEPAQVEQVTGRSGVSEAPTGLTQSGDYQGCFYDDDTRQIFLTTSFARGFEGTDGQRTAERVATALGPSEPLPGIGAGAAYSPGKDGQAFVLVAFADARGGLLTVTVQGEIPRDQLEALARQVADNL